MKRLIFPIICCMVAVPTFAWQYASVAQTTNNYVQIRTGASFTKHFNHGINLSINEDLRFDAYNQEGNSRVFNKSYTTLTFAYKPIQYLKIDAGYTLKLLGTKDWSDPNEWLRHRVFFSLTGIYKYEQWKFSLRERLLCEMRTDSVNLTEKNRYDLMLRSKFDVQYTVRHKPLKPYIWVELINTLNAPKAQQLYTNNDPNNYSGRQYISKVRTGIGIVWRLTARSSLDFYYQFKYNYNRNINITRKSQKIELTEETGYLHAIGVKYEFDW